MSYCSSVPKTSLAGGAAPNAGPVSAGITRKEGTSNDWGLKGRARWHSAWRSSSLGLRGSAATPPSSSGNPPAGGGFGQPGSPPGNAGKDRQSRCDIPTPGARAGASCAGPLLVDSSSERYVEGSAALEDRAARRALARAPRVRQGPPQQTWLAATGQQNLLPRFLLGSRHQTTEKAGSPRASKPSSGIS